MDVRDIQVMLVEGRRTRHALAVLERAGLPRANVQVVDEATARTAMARRGRTNPLMLMMGDWSRHPEVPRDAEPGQVGPLVLHDDLTDEGFVDLKELLEAWPAAGYPFEHPFGGPKPTRWSPTDPVGRRGQIDAGVDGIFLPRAPDGEVTRASAPYPDGGTASLLLLAPANLAPSTRNLLGYVTLQHEGNGTREVWRWSAPGWPSSFSVWAATSESFAAATKYVLVKAGSSATEATRAQWEAAFPSPTSILWQGFHPATAPLFDDRVTRWYRASRGPAGAATGAPVLALSATRRPDGRFTPGAWFGSAASEIVLGAGERLEFVVAEGPPFSTAYPAVNG